MGDIDRVQRAAPAIQPDVRSHKIGHVDQRDGRRHHEQHPPPQEDQVELTSTEDPVAPSERPSVLGDDTGLDIAV